MLAKVTPVWIWYSLSNMRQLYISSIQAKFEDWLLVDFCVFTSSYIFLPVVNLKLFFLNQVKTGKTQKSTHNQLSSFWFNWQKHGTVSYLFGCTAVQLDKIQTGVNFIRFLNIIFLVKKSLSCRLVQYSTAYVIATIR